MHAPPLYLVGIALVSLAGLAHAQVRQAAPGDIATGEIVKEERGQLLLNPKPCNGDGTLVVFHEPYAKEQRGTIQCGATRKKITQVVQKR